MIKKISIQNFKNFKNNELSCNNLNILTGMNGMGKSSLIQLLLILRQSYLKGAFFEDNKYISLGDPERDDYIEIGDYRDAIYQDFEQEEDFIRTEIQFSDNTATWQTESYYDLGENIFELPVKTTNVNNNIFTEALFAKKKFQFIKAERIGPRETLPINHRKIKNKDFGADGRYAMHYFMENWKKKISIKELAHPNEENLLLELQINAWLNEISPSIRVKSIFHQTDKNKIIPQFDYNLGGLNKRPFKAKNVGFGISYIFSVVMSILTAEKNDLIIIENPEAHLHPSGQTKLSKLAAIAAQNGVQIFIETHSDHILNGCLLSVKDNLRHPEWGINKELVNIFYFGRHKTEHKTKITLINIDDNLKFYQKNKKGEQVHLPKGFFDEWGNTISKLI